MIQIYGIVLPGQSLSLEAVNLDVVGSRIVKRRSDYNGLSRLYCSLTPLLAVHAGAFQGWLG